ncbi:MbtH family protein [Roseibium sp. RKSG952]|uniref:MbtH family protein n=1 Tax=Roseibium sp. RKSG952 TaxID=2529384 RepID=UPI0012BBFB57|nr:MbtH family protein [Roseibium sp. RKSG952]MTH96465.1 MbtH family protein [Roseibium sp. RKSG952]
MANERIGFMVLVNQEDQHSLWPVFNDIPDGWKQVGPVGSKKICLEHVEQAWPDITPLSGRKQLAETMRERNGLTG